MILISLALAALQDATVPGELRSHATLHSLGFEWDLQGDSNHNATCAVRYRIEGSEAWKDSLPLFRVDFHGWYADTKADRAYNMLAGSVLFLQPGTAYEVTLDLSDPDGGSASKTVLLRTRPVPSLARDGRTFHVAPGTEGGDGSEANPFRGLATAQAAARPGDVFLLGPGEYGSFACDRSGEPGRRVAWKGAEGAILSSLDVAARHVWFEGLTFRKADRDTALRGKGPTADVALVRNRFTGFRNSVIVGREGRDWYIADNVVEGINDPEKSNLEGEGIDLARSGGHVVCHNRISRVQAGVHYPLRNCDIYGNDIFDTTDDGIEPDYGYANLRFWGNRITNFGNNALSFQPMYCGPWYFIRNQVIGTGYMFKFRVQDRFLLAHNTFVAYGLVSDRCHHLLYSLSRNNLYIAAGPKSDRPLWAANRYRDEDARHVRTTDTAPAWMSDVDYDGFDWGGRPGLSWGKPYADLAAFARDAGIEKNALRVRKEEIFETWDLPERPGRVEPKVLALRQGANAVDAGAVLPGINEDYAGKAPDLGAHERGKPRTHYGPRP